MSSEQSVILSALSHTNHLPPHKQKQHLFNLLERRGYCQFLVSEAAKHAPLIQPEEEGVKSAPMWAALVRVISVCSPIEDDRLYDILSTTVKYEDWADIA